MLDLITSVIMLNVNGQINIPSKGQKLSDQKKRKKKKTRLLAPYKSKHFKHEKLDRLKI